MTKVGFGKDFDELITWLRKLNRTDAENIGDAHIMRIGMNEIRLSDLICAKDEYYNENLPEDASKKENNTMAGTPDKSHEAT